MGRRYRQRPDKVYKGLDDLDLLTGLAKRNNFNSAFETIVSVRIAREGFFISSE